MRLNKDAQEIVDYAKRFGYKFAGFHGSGHIKLQHIRGFYVVVSSTPSDHRSRKNEKRTLVRMAGMKEMKPNAGKFSHKKQEGFTNTRATPADDDSPWVKAEQLIGECDERIVGINPRSDEARRLAAFRLYLEGILNKYYQPVPPRPKVFD